LGAYDEIQKAFSVTTNNEQNISTSRLARAGKAGKVVILFIFAFVGSACILLYFDLHYVLIALLAILAVAISVVLFTKQTYYKIYSLPAVITSLLLGASCVTMAYSVYGDFMSAHTKSSLKILGLGYFMIGIGFAVATSSIAMSSMNKFDFWKSEYAIEFKYPKRSLIMVFISGAFVFVVGLYIVVNSLQNLLLV
jgi:hypothetical protein